MYEISNRIKAKKFDGLSVEKLSSQEGCETLLIILEEGHTFPKHTSPRDVLLVMLEGAVTFYINNTTYFLQEQQTFSFPAKEEHSVIAKENSRFLIIR